MPNFKEVYVELKKHLDRTTNQALNEQDFIGYMERVGNTNQAQVEMSERDKAVHDIVLNQLLTNQKAAKDLVGKLPLAQKAKSEQIKKLQQEAELFARADAKKKEAAQINERRKAARRELERIRQERIKNAAKEKGREATEAELAKPKIYDDEPAARGRHLFTGAMNYFGLGSRSVRRGLNKDGQKREDLLYANKEGATPITHKSKDGKIKLTGGMFKPQNPKVPEKVALVFTGSHGPGTAYIDSIKDAYLAKGITVVQLDYRGFGNSTNLGANGQPVSNSPSERTMYEDGMEMYRYVNEELGIDPENITLHGYSLGGAIASRVALDVTKKLENRRIMENEPYDPTKGLGGVVLHSPMKSMYYAGKNDFWIPGGFAGWAFGGGYNTEEHMLELAKVDKNIPVHMIGGYANKDSNDFDWLAPEATGLEDSLRGKFNNYTTYHGAGDHEGRMYMGKKKDDEGKYILDEKGEKIDVFEPLPNVVPHDNGLSTIVNQGREVNQVRKRELEQARVGGPQAGGPQAN